MNEEALNMVIETILSSEKVENSDRLHLVKVDLGDHVVQIATSLASFFNASDLIGKQVPVKTDVKNHHNPWREK